MRRMELVLSFLVLDLLLFYHSYLALLRDGYRCVITGAVDAASLKAYPNQLTALSAAHGSRKTQCAHILSPSTSQGISGDNTYGRKVKLSYSYVCDAA